MIRPWSVGRSAGVRIQNWELFLCAHPPESNGAASVTGSFYGRDDRGMAASELRVETLEGNIKWLVYK